MQVNTENDSAAPPPTAAEFFPQVLFIQSFHILYHTQLPQKTAALSTQLLQLTRGLMLLSDKS